jgi:hypothetical protein
MTVPRTEATGICAACRAVLPATRLEPVPTDRSKVRCIDEDACRKRYTPRRLAFSARPEGTRRT